MWTKFRLWKKFNTTYVNIPFPFRTVNRQVEEKPRTDAYTKIRGHILTWFKYVIAEIVLHICILIVVRPNCIKLNLFINLYYSLTCYHVLTTCHWQVAHPHTQSKNDTHIYWFFYENDINLLPTLTVLQVVTLKTKWKLNTM